MVVADVYPALFQWCWYSVVQNSLCCVQSVDIKWLNFSFTDVNSKFCLLAVRGKNMKSKKKNSTVPSVSTHNFRNSASLVRGVI